jgi:hypothetical protein
MAKEHASNIGAIITAYPWVSSIDRAFTEVGLPGDDRGANHSSTSLDVAEEVFVGIASPR